MFKRCIPLLLIAGMPLLGQQPDRLSIQACMESAWKDLSALPQELRPGTRYIGLWHLDSLEDRIEATAALSVICNGMSRRKHMEPLAVVPGSKIAVLRVNLDDYRWDHKVWDRLADPHTTIGGRDEWWPGGVWPTSKGGDGKYYEPANYRTKVIAAPWLGDKAPEVAGWTGSTVAMVNGGWFAHQMLTCTDEDGNLRNPSYYDFLGIKNEKDFQRLTGTNVDLAEEFGAVQREAVGISGVTRKPRAFVFLGKLGGFYYKTLDFQSSREARNALAVLGKDIEKKARASEQIAGLVNGLLAYGLFDLTKKDNPVVDRAPDTVAGSRTLPGNFLAVQNPIGCIDCHRDRSLQPIDGWIRNLLTPPLDIYTPDYKKRLQLRDEYLSDLEESLEHGRKSYERAVKDCSKRAGKEMTATQFADSCRKLFVTHEEPRTLASSAAYLGVSTEAWAKALDQRIRQIRGPLPLSQLILGKGRQQVVPYDVFEEYIEEAQLILRGYVK